MADEPRAFRLIALDQRATQLVVDALGQWAEEYATVEEHAIAHRIIARLSEEGVEFHAGSAEQ